MDSKKESRTKVALNDELLDQVSGGFGVILEPKQPEYYCDPILLVCGNRFKSSTKPDYCIFCHRRDSLVEQ